MPRCQNCGNAVRSYELRRVGDTVICPECVRPKCVEDVMSDEKKRVLSVILNEVPTVDKAVDHEIEIEGGYGGLEVKFKTTFDDIRNFFTQKREKGSKSRLQSVK